MIDSLGQVMLYVEDQDKAVKFWRDVVGFQVIADETNQHMRWIEIAPTAQSETSLILHNKKVIAEMEPELNLETPSLMFFTENLDALYKRLKEHTITVGEIVEMPTARVFNFADYEDHYFAVMEKS